MSLKVDIPTLPFTMNGDTFLPVDDETECDTHHGTPAIMALEVKVEGDDDSILITMCGTCYAAHLHRKHSSKGPTGRCDGCYRERTGITISRGKALCPACLEASMQPIADNDPNHEEYE